MHAYNVYKHYTDGGIVAETFVSGDNSSKLHDWCAEAVCKDAGISLDTGKNGDILKAKLNGTISIVPTCTCIHISGYIGKANQAAG